MASLQSFLLLKPSTGIAVMAATDSGLVFGREVGYKFAALILLLAARADFEHSARAVKLVEAFGVEPKRSGGFLRPWIAPTCRPRNAKRRPQRGGVGVQADFRLSPIVKASPSSTAWRRGDSCLMRCG